MHSWKDLSRIAWSFVIAILMASTSGKRVPFDTLEFREQEKIPVSQVW